MADETTLKVGVEADATDAVRDMKAAATAAASLADSFREIASVAVSAANALTKAERGVTGNTTAQKNAAQATKGTTAAIDAQADAARNLGAALSGLAKAGFETRNLGNIHTPGTGSTRSSTSNAIPRSDIGVGVDKASRESLEASNFARQQAIKLRNDEQNAIKQTVLANIAETRAWRELNGVKKDVAGTSQQVTAANTVLGQSARTAGQSVESLRDNLFTARFALNDISRGTAIAGAALIAFNAATVNAAATYESAMASIDRTTGATTDQMKLIRDQFVQLAQTIPGGFNNLGQIGELAGQLNIPSQRIADFTEVVAQFTSTTDVAVQASAEAFGRLDTLLPDVQGNYEALGSSILNVGVNSVATESAIISTTTQIAAAAAQARFTADEVIGLAAAYASLGVAPEAARGSTIRIFSEIRQAAVEGGDALDTFSKIAGMSGDEFKNAWLNGDSSAVFMDFLKGLQKEGAGAEQTLRDLGITGVRDINALLRLSQNVDIVSQSFGYANDGFTEATQLADAFGITSATLNSRLDLLGQSFQALFAVLGESGTGPIKEFVNLLIDMIKVMTDVAKNPVAQWIAVFGGLFTLLAGGVLLITSFVARMGAMAVAVATTRIELQRMQAELIATNGTLTATQGAAFKAATAMTAFGTVMKGVLIGSAIAVGVTLILAGIDAIGNATQSAGDKAKKSFGDLSGLSNALKKDTDELTNSSGEIEGALGTVEGKLTTVTNKASEWVKGVEGATGAQTNLATTSDLTTTSVEAQTYAIGKNTAAWLAAQLASNQTVVDLVKNNDYLAKQSAPTVDVKGVIAASVANDTKAALAIIQDYQNRVNEYLKSGNATQAGIEIANQNLANLKETFDVTTGALSEAAAQGQITDSVYSALGVSAETAAITTTELGDESVTTADKLSLIRDAVTTAFGDYTTLQNFAAAARDLFQGIADGGAAFDGLGEATATNIGNLQNAIVTAISAGEALGVNATDSVSALFLSLQQQGINTANLLASLASIPGIGSAGVGKVKATLAGQRALTSSGQQMADVYNKVAASTQKATKSIGGGGGGGGLGGAAKDAAKEIRTLLDYGSELAGVFDRAFDLRFGAQQGTDKITSGWIKMREAVDAANKSIADAQAKMQELNSNNSILEYFKSIADAYGDTLRSNDIAAEIANNNAELASESDKAAKASETLSKGLVGNSSSAIDNRDQITGLIKSYEDLLVTYANSGLDQAQLTQKAQDLKAEFMAQATQLGYNSSELGVYAAAFDDVTVAIGRVPRNITVSADINPALQALNEFEAKAAQAARNASSSIASGGGGGYTPNIDYGVWDWAGGRAGSAFGASFAYRLAGALQAAEFYAPTLAAIARAGGSASIGLSAFGLKSGGYTGNAGTDNFAGFVHGKEYVINAGNTARLGLPFLNALNNGGTPVVPSSSGNGGGIQVVELSARDRQLLAAAGNVSLSIDGKLIATATNSANFVAAQRGSS